MFSNELNIIITCCRSTEREKGTWFIFNFTVIILGFQIAENHCSNTLESCLLQFHVNIPTSSVLLETLPNKVNSNTKKSTLYLIFFQLIHIQMSHILLGLWAVMSVGALLFIIILHCIMSCDESPANGTDRSRQEHDGAGSMDRPTEAVDVETAVLTWI